MPTDKQRLKERQKPDASVVMKQDWSHLLFLHWEIDPTVIQSTLPQGLYVDTHEGKAYLGVVPFFMEKIRPVYCPAVPGLSWFQELNLRTYVYDEQGRPGVWFYALDCNQWFAVKIARSLFHLPYQHAKMNASQRNGMVTYTSQRKGCQHSQVFKYPSHLSHSEVSQPGSLEFFLLERYRLFSTKGDGTIHSGSVHHPPYQFQKAKISDYSTRIISLCGFEEPTTPPVSSLIAETVSVDIYPLEKSAKPH